MKTVIRKNDVNYPQDRIPSSFDSENVAYGDTNVKEKLDEISSNLPLYRIWYNNNPDTSFAAQPISIPTLSDYAYIEVVYRRYSGQNYFVTTGLVPVINGGGAECVATANAQVYTRDIAINTTSETISFTDCLRIGTYGDPNSYVVANTSIVPYFICGRKN